MIFLGFLDNTLRAGTFAGIKFRVFRVFWSFSRKFLPMEIINHQNAKVFSHEITNIFQRRKFFWQVTNSCSIFSREYELYTEFAKFLSANFVTNLSKRESFCQQFRVFFFYAKLNARESFCP